MAFYWSNFIQEQSIELKREMMTIIQNYSTEQQNAKVAKFQRVKVAKMQSAKMVNG